MIGPEWLWHPLGECAGRHAEVIRCQSYNWWSGISSIVSEKLGWLALLGLWWHHHNCQEKGCPWLVKHSHTHCRKHQAP